MIKDNEFYPCENKDCRNYRGFYTSASGALGRMINDNLGFLNVCLLCTELIKENFYVKKES